MPFTETEFGPEKQIDINAALSVLEDFIKQNNKTSDTAQSKTPNILQPELPGV